MTNAVHLQSGAANESAALVYNFGSTRHAYYVRAQVYVPAATWANWAAVGPGASLFVQSPDTDPANSEEEIVMRDGDGLRDFWGDYFGGNDFPQDTWNVFELWINSVDGKDPSWWKLNG